MNSRLLSSALLLCGTPLLAQTQTAPAVHTSDLGFSYSVPSDWETADTRPTLPAAQQEAAKNATTDEEKKGIACVQIALTARHGDPRSVIVIVALPFDCFGQTMTEKDLPGFAEGASEGLKSSFDVAEPEYGAYSLGTHNMWIERAKGSPKGHPEVNYTVEIACSLLKKGAVCWMTMAADESALRTFENGAVTLDGDSFASLVAPVAFDKKPSP
jgi:hypothetical protein